MVLKSKQTCIFKNNIEKIKNTNLKNSKKY